MHVGHLNELIIQSVDNIVGSVNATSDQCQDGFISEMSVAPLGPDHSPHQVDMVRLNRRLNLFNKIAFPLAKTNTFTFLTIENAIIVFCLSLFCYLGRSMQPCDHILGNGWALGYLVFYVPCGVPGRVWCLIVLDS